VTAAAPPTDAAGRPSRKPLRCLGGKRPPAGLDGDLHRLLALPPEAAARFWSVLGPSLAEPLPPATEQQLDAFCGELGLSKDDLARPLKACRFLVREAARLDLAKDDLASDLHALCPDAPELYDLVLSGYESARGLLREELLLGSLADHGKLFTGADWRLDAVHASNRGRRMRVPVALVTLRYREGSKTKRITLQLLPSMLEELKSTLAEITP
jgi:hypothetical protein